MTSNYFESVEFNGSTNDGRRTLLINPSFALFIGSSTMSDGEHEKAMSGGDTTGDNNDDFFACISQSNTAFVIQHGIVDSLDHRNNNMI